MEIWNDRVTTRDLLLALAISTGFIVAGAVIATLLGQSLLFWGLGAAACGFALNCMLIHPKRTFVTEPTPTDSPEEAHR